MPLPEITIAIPVYNGADTIAEAMLSALTQLTINDELIVVDNNSTDQTPNIVKQYQLTYSNLRYYKNPCNIGYDRNFNACFLNAKHDYVWLLGDDDLIAPDSVSYVKDLLSQHHPDSLILNYGVIDRASNSIITKAEIPITQTISSNSDKSYFLTLLADYPIFISATIFSRSAWLNSSPEIFFDTLFIHFGIYLMLVSYGTVIATPKTCLYNKCRLNNIAHKPSFYRSYLSNLKRLVLLIQNHRSLSNNTKLKYSLIRKLLDKNLLKYIYIHKRSRGKIPIDDLFFFARYFRFSFSYFIGLFFIVLPSQVVYAYHLLFKHAREIKRLFFK